MPKHVQVHPGPCRAGVTNAVAGPQAVRLILLCVLTALHPTASQEPSGGSPDSEAVARQIKTRIVIPALKSLQAIQKKLSEVPTREELEKALMQQSALSQNDYICLAVINHHGELLACAPNAMTPLVKRVAALPEILQHVKKDNGAYLKESQGNPKGYRTYDLFLPMHEGGVYTNAVIGMCYSRFYPLRFLKEVAVSMDLSDRESFHVLSRDGDLVFSSVDKEESPSELLQPEFRASRSSMRTQFKRMQREKEGRHTYVSMAEFFIGLIQHDLSWTHMELPGTTWIVIHDRIVPARQRDPDNALTGLWEAHRGNPVPGGEDPPAPLFEVSMIQEDTWWCMRGGGEKWPFRAEGRFLEGRMLSNRISQLDDRNQVVFSLQGRYDEVQDKIYLEIYRQQKRRVITTSCILKRSPSTQDNNEQLQLDIPLRISAGNASE